MARTLKLASILLRYRALAKKGAKSSFRSLCSNLLVFEHFRRFSRIKCITPCSTWELTARSFLLNEMWISPTNHIFVLFAVHIFSEDFCGGGGFDMRFFSKISPKHMALLGLLFLYHAPYIFLLYHGPSLDLSILASQYILSAFLRQFRAVGSVCVVSFSFYY